MKLRLLATVLLATSITGATSALADPPKRFLHDAVQGDNSEIMLGNIAVQQGRSGEVRRFGQTLVDDHRKARVQAQNVARHHRVYVSNRDIAPMALHERDRLSGMRGHEFDVEFARYMVDDHNQDIDKFRDEANKGHGEVANLARAQLPTLRKHLDIARGILEHEGSRYTNTGYENGRHDDNNGRHGDNGHHY
jgi:putative membrane protein